MGLCLKNTAIGMIQVLQQYTQLERMFSTLQQPTVGELFDYLSSIRDDVKFLDIPSYDLISSRDFLYENLLLTTSKQINSPLVDDIYTESFHTFVLNGFKYLHASPIFTISNLDLFSAFNQLGGKFQISCKKVFIVNDVYYLMTTKDTSCIVFLSHMNIKSLYRTNHTLVPINELYFLTKHAIGLDKKQDILIDTICMSIDNQKSILYITHNRMPFEIFPIEFVSSQMEVLTLQSKFTLAQLSLEIKLRNTANVLFGQSINDTLSIDELDRFIVNRYIPHCFVWRKITNAMCVKESEKLLLILTLAEGKVVVFYKLTINNFKVPPPIKQTFLPKATLLKEKFKPLIQRLTQNIYYIPSIKAIFTTNYSILNIYQDASKKVVGNLNVIERDYIVNLFKQTFDEDLQSEKRLFHQHDVTLTKLNFKNVNIITICSSSRTPVNITSFLRTYITSLQLHNNNHLVINTLLTLFNITV